MRSLRRGKLHRAARMADLACEHQVARLEVVSDRGADAYHRNRPAGLRAADLPGVLAALGYRVIVEGDRQMLVRRLREGGEFFSYLRERKQIVRARHQQLQPQS